MLTAFAGSTKLYCNGELTTLKEIYDNERELLSKHLLAKNLGEEVEGICSECVEDLDEDSKLVIYVNAWNKDKDRMDPAPGYIVKVDELESLLEVHLADDTKIRCTAYSKFALAKMLIEDMDKDDEGYGDCGSYDYYPAKWRMAKNLREGNFLWTVYSIHYPNAKISSPAEVGLKEYHNNLGEPEVEIMFTSHHKGSPFPIPVESIIPLEDRVELYAIVMKDHDNYVIEPGIVVRDYY